MDIQDIRRTNLKRWVDANGTPAAEKSYFSQIINGASFGERAARRLEREYKLGDGYLDQTDKTDIVDAPPELPDGYIDADELMHLIRLYEGSTALGRRQIMDAAETSAKTRSSRRGKSAND